jgi:beta-lactamase class A
MKKNKLIIAGLCVVLAAVCIYVSVDIWRSYTAYCFRKEQLQRKKAAWSLLEQKIKSEIETFGQEAAVVVEDLSNGWKISINGDKLFPSASLVKVPIMASLFSVCKEQGVDLKQCLVLTNKNKALGSGILKSYASGTEFNLEDLVEIMVTKSDNTAANMLIDYLGFDALNNYFKKLGLNNTNLVRKMMDFKSRREGLENFTSANDLAHLLEEMYNFTLIDNSFSQKCLEILKKQKIKDRIPARLPADTVVAHKTGLERGICHDAGIVFTPGGNFIVCVLTRHNYKVSKPAKKFISQVALDVYAYYQPGNS